MYEPKIGDYVVVKTNGIAAKLIRLGTLSRWNHAAIVVSTDKVVLIAEARPTGVTIRPVTQYSKYAYNQHETLTDEQREVIADYALHQVGKSYDFLDILILGARILGLRLPPGRFWEKLATKNGFICSELVVVSYKHAGLDLVDKPDCFVTPGDLAERLIYQ